MNHVVGKKPLRWPELIQQARNGDDMALGQIVSRVRNYLMVVADGSLNQRLQSKLSASDIVQQSMLEAQQSIDRFKGSSEAQIRAWLKKIVLCNLVDSTRQFIHAARRLVNSEVSMQRLSVPPCQPRGQTASWYVSRSETDEQLLREIKRLPDRQRHVIEARHRLGRSYQKIASDMKATEDAARKLWSRGVQRLKEVLGDQ